MGDLGNAVKTQVESLIDDDNLKSSGVISSITFTEGSYGGYSKGTATTTATASINCIPSSYVKTKIGLQIYGDLEEGDVRMLVKDGTTIDSDDLVLFNGDSFHVREIRPIFFNEVVVAKAIVMTKRTT